MANTYFDLIQQSYSFPQEGLSLQDNSLLFQGVSIKKLIEKHGTPFRLMYLPKIGEQIEKARDIFKQSIQKHQYKGQYHFCYCTKCNHFYHVINKALQHQVHLETSSSFDIELILNLYKEGKIDLQRTIIHNGYKTDEYLRKIVALQEEGFENSILILDGEEELNSLLKIASKYPVKIGLRMAVNEPSQSAYYTSRLGIRPKEMLPFFEKNIQNEKRITLKMFHFFVDSGIEDSLYYWGEFQKALNIYVALKQKSESLDSFNLGGGFPIRNHMGFKYSYEDIADKIVGNLKNICKDNAIQEPDIYTEFGKYTVGESGAIIFKVLDQKKQNDTELWYIIDNSLLNTIPDAWSIHEKFILLPINKWENAYQRVNIGGLSCDQNDYYNSEDLNQEIRLPQYSKEDKEPLYLGFFHTGAYQDAISGYGGIKHCLIPSPKQVIIDFDEHGILQDYVYREEQSASEMFKILGYNSF